MAISISGQNITMSREATSREVVGAFFWER